MVDEVSPDDLAAAGLARLLSRAQRGIEKRQERIAELEGEVATLKSEAKRLRQAESVLAGSAADYSTGHWCEVVRQIDRAKDLGAVLDQFAEGTSAEVASIRANTAALADQALSELSSALPAELEAAGLAVDALSRFPIFKLRNGFFEIKINKPKLEAQVSVRHGSMHRLAADLDLIVAAVKAEDARCFGSPLDQVDFVARLRAAYLVVLGPDRPRPLSLEAVRQALSEPALPRDEFAVGLAALLRDRPNEGAGLGLDHTKDIETGFLLPGFEDRGYFGHITFTSL